MNASLINVWDTREVNVAVWWMRAEKDARDGTDGKDGWDGQLRSAPLVIRISDTFEPEENYASTTKAD